MGRVPSLYKAYHAHYDLIMQLMPEDIIFQMERVPDSEGLGSSLSFAI